MTESVHLLCAPFPTAQGTQASVAAFVRAANACGAEHSLLVPAESHGDPPEGVPLERLRPLPVRLGARSGPSFARVAADVATLAQIRGCVRDRPLFAHNVEAAFIAATARIPFVYVAHTSMTDELPMYGRGGARTKRRLGAMLDRIAVTAARRTVAITPDLAQTLERRFGRPVAYLPQPWRPAAPTSPREREAARTSLGVEDACVILHAGNLDRYQGLRTVVDASRALAATRDVALLVATESDPSGIPPADDLRVLPHRLGSEVDRRRVHAAADVVVIARETTHGLPIKMLDAFARGVPVVATRGSLAGLALSDELITTDPDASAIAAAIPRAIRERDPIVDAARAYLVRRHSDREAVAVLEAAQRASPALPRRRDRDGAA